ncbi:MAG: cyclic nucleotide-binding domain-containing protein [Desulfobacterales bacterium]|jgi:CRP-like cAMP-binding protein
MITKDEMRKMVILGYLTDSMLEKIIPIVERKHAHDQEIIFRQGESAERFFMVSHGKILLEHRISDKMTVSIEAVRPGYSFGWSGMMTGGIEPYNRYTSDAIAAEASELFILKGEDLNNLLESDEHMGFLIYQRLTRVIARRLRHRTEQFVRIIKQHPDIDNLIID